MSKYISLENLERYDAKIQEHFASFCASKEDGMWRQTEKAGAVQFWPVGNSPLEGTVEFMFKETPPASGDKSPTNPSTISGVSSINITRANSNLMRWPYYDPSGKEQNGITWTVNEDGTVSATGTATGQSGFGLQSTNFIEQRGILLPPGTYRLSGCPSGGIWNQTWALRVVMAPSETSHATTSTDFGNGSTITVAKPVHVSFFCSVWAGNTVSNLTFAPKLQLIETPFEKNEQNVSTVSLGGTYYGGSIDLATGLMTVTKAEATLTGNEDWSLSSDSTDSISIFGASSVLSYTPKPELGSVCTHIPLYSGPVVLNSFRVYTNKAVFLRLSAADFPDVSTLQTWMQAQNSAGTPVKITYTIATPYTVQLTAPQIRSLVQPDKYVPRINTVYTDADAVKIVYQKNPVRDKFEKVQAIIAQGGNV